MKSAKIVATLTLCLSLVTAWPRWLPEPDALVVRQDNQDNTATSATATTPRQTATPGSSRETTAATSTNRNLNTATAPNTQTGGTQTGTQTGTARSGSRTGTQTRTTHRTFAADDPAGSVVMVTPATTTGTPIFKINDYVTFGWSYTNVQAAPSAVDVILSCSAATETWTLTANMTFQTSAAYVWDSSVQASAVESPLLTEMYTLIIIDAASSISATAEPGYLAPYSGLTFGMYKPAKYTPLSEWHCGSCNSALGGFDSRAVGLALGMSAVTVLSFTWFVTGFGVNLF